jgi:hypothetical protein
MVSPSAEQKTKRRLGGFKTSKWINPTERNFNIRDPLERWIINRARDGRYEWDPISGFSNGGHDVTR